MNLGWIGLGSMGLAMARNALRAGHSLTVYNRTRSRADELALLGARVAGTPGEAAQGGCVVTMLSDDAAVEEIVSGGLLQALPPGGIHCCAATISVEQARRLTEAHRSKGQVYVSAPVFGRPEAAAAAKLYVVAAGPRDALQRLQPLFDAVGQRTTVMGEEPVAANITKISGNFLIASTIECLAEAITLARKYGVDPRQYYELLTTSLFSAPVYKTYGEPMVEDKFEPVGFKMNLGLKDARLVLAAADEAGVPMPVANVVHDRLLSGVARGLQDADWASIARIVGESAGLNTIGRSS